MLAESEINTSSELEDHLKASSDQAVSLRHPFTVPTHLTMQYGVCISRRDVWDIYSAIAYTHNQGTEWFGRTITSGRRQTGHGTAHPLYTIKQEEINSNAALQPLPKPLHPNVTVLHHVFCNNATISFVYEEMDMSLSQVLSHPLEPSISYPAQSHRLIGAIFKQILCGVEYVHPRLHVAHGGLCLSNVLMNRNGIIKLANVGHSILRPTTDYQNDFQMLCTLFKEVVSWLGADPRNALYERIWALLSEGSLTQVQQVWRTIYFTNNNANGRIA
ncbi:hypothetical protein LTR86_011074 [Recurvomyces mirabilis]|nr:hypothetical protein LTR86_011074 [Recurvomyces mirabilis]